MLLRRLLLFLAAVLAGCADFGDPIDGGGRRLSPEEERFQVIETRLAEVGRKVDNISLAQQTQDLRRLQDELRSLRGDIESLQNAINGSERRSKDLYQDLDRRLQKLENEGRPARLTMEPRIANAPAAPPTQEEEAMYLRTFDQLKAGKYDDAIAGFRELVQRYPQGKYTDNAWYWMGESYFIKRDLKSAEEAFQSLVERFPASPKVPDGLYRMVELSVEQKRTDAAKGFYDRLLKNYPNSSAAAKARQKFAQLG